MSDKQTVSDKGAINKYFSIIPHIDDDDLDPFEYRLLGHYRKFCGLYGHGCDETLQETAAASKMSVKAVRKARKSLKAKGRIGLKIPKGEAAIITLLDCMAENIKRYSTPSQNDRGSEDTPSQNGTTPLPKTEGVTPQMSAPQQTEPDPLRIEESEERIIPPEIGISGSTPKADEIKLTPVEKVVKAEMESTGIAIAHNTAERQAELALIEKGIAAPIGCVRGVKPAKEKPLSLTGASFLQVWVNTIGKDRFPRTMNYKTLGGAAKNLITANPTLSVDDVKAAAELFKAYLDGLNGSCPILEWHPAQLVSFFKLADDMHRQAISSAMVKWYVEDEKKSAFWVGKTISFQHVANNVQSAIKERKPNLDPQPTAPKPVCPICNGQGWIEFKDETGKTFGRKCECIEVGAA